MPRDDHRAVHAIPVPAKEGVTEASSPKQLLGTIDVIAIITGIVIGAGIFSAPALVAANSSSVTQMMAAWVLGGLISLGGALCYAELSTTHPSAGGEYHFLRLAFGHRISFLFAWARLTIIPTGSIALLGFVFGDYATKLYELGPYSSAIYAVAMVLMLTALNVVGLKSGKTTQNILTMLEVLGVVLIIGVGFWYAPPTSGLPDWGDAGNVSNWGLVLIFVMLTYGGWNEAAYVSAEVLGPGKNLPRALAISLALITTLYFLVNWAYLSVLGLPALSQSNTIAADMMQIALGPAGASIVATLIAVSALTSANATILTGARTGFAFGRNSSLFSALGHWHPERNAPVRALWVQAAIVLALILVGALTRSGFATMVEYTAPVFWLFFVLTGVALFVLRRKFPDRVRPYSVPLYPLLPLIFCATSAYLLYASVRHTGIGALVGLSVLAMGALLLLLTRSSSNPVTSS